MRIKYIEPRAELRSVISRFWYGEVQQENPLAPSSYRIVASGNTGMVIQLFQNQSRLYNSHNQKQLPLAFIYGQKSDTPCLNHFSAEVTIVGVDFQPTAFTRIFGVNTTELTNTLADAVTLLPNCLLRQLQECETVAVAVALLERYFLKHTLTTTPQLGIDYAIQQIRQAPCIIDTSDIAIELGMSRRTFQRRFKDQVGIDAQTYSRIIRFQRALYSIQQSRTTSITQLAYDLGYADQSHFGREFKLFIGDSPKVFAKPNKTLVELTKCPLTPFRILGVE